MNNLSAKDLRAFHRLGITAELLERACIQRVTDAEAREKFGITGFGDMGGIAFPYFTPTDGVRRTCRVRRDNPEIEDGKPRKKYVYAYGDRPHLYFVPACVELMNDFTVTIILVESEKAVLALTAWAERTGRKVLPVGLGGCWGFRGRIGKVVNAKGERVDEKGPLPDLAVCSNRDVIVMMDSNADSKPEVRAARSELVRELERMGARVRIASIPALAGVNGPDDLIAVRGDGAIHHVLELARPAAELALAEVEAAIGEILAAKPNITAEQMRRALDAIADVSDSIQRAVLQSRLAEAVRGVIAKKTLLHEVTERRQERKAREQNFSRENREAELRAMPVDATRLVEELEAFFAERAHLPEGAALVLAYFALNTWTFNLFDTVPYLLLESAVPGCGKSTVIRLLEATSCRSRKATSLSEAVMFRLIDAETPTLLVDEAETIEGRSERSEALRAIAHEGYKKGGLFAQPLGKFPGSISEADRKRLHDQTIAAIRESVNPAYVKFAKFVREEYAPHGRTEAGIWSLPDGGPRYAVMVKRSTTTDLTPEDIHQIGLKQVAEIEAQMLVIAQKLGYTDLKTLNADIEKDSKLHAHSRQQILDLYRSYSDTMWKQLPTAFGHLPKATLEVMPIEEFREKEAATHYNQGTPDGSRPGHVMVNTGDFEHRKLISIESTAYHEGVPGHHMQISIAQELPTLPPFRQHAFYGAFIEGWALYSEKLGKEMGFYRDPYSDYGRLQDEMWRAIRLVVDTGLHYKHWTRQQVVDYFHAHSAIDEPDVQSEADRYIAWPAQALSYKIGQLKILELRERARKQLGDKFDQRVFHDEVLGGGALPLDVLETRIGEWIVGQNKGALETAPAK